MTEVAVPKCHFHTIPVHWIGLQDRICSKLNKFCLLGLISVFYVLQTTSSRAETASSMPVEHSTALVLTGASRLWSWLPCSACDLPYDIPSLHTQIPSELTEPALTPEISATAPHTDRQPGRGALVLPQQSSLCNTKRATQGFGEHAYFGMLSNR